MNKENFLKLDVTERAEYFNIELSKNAKITVTDICKNLKIDEKKNRKFFKENNFEYNRKIRKYEKLDDEHKENITVTHSKSTVEIVDSYKENTIVTHSEIDIKTQENIIEIMRDAEILKEMIKLYKENTTVLHQKLVIELPDAPTKHTTIRANEKVLNDFNIFADNNKQYSKIDLISVALKEFVEKYN